MMKLYYQTPTEKKYLADVKNRSEAMQIIYNFWESLYVRLHTLVMDRDENGNTTIVVNNNGCMYILEE